MSRILCQLLQLYVLVIFAQIIMSWFPLDPDGVAAKIRSVLWRLTDPVFRPLRAILPPLRLGGLALDLTPIVVLIAINLLVLPLVC